MRSAFLTLLLSLSALAACSSAPPADAPEPAAAEAPAEPEPAEETTPPAVEPSPVTATEVQGILQAKCAVGQCHGGAHFLDLRSDFAAKTVGVSPNAKAGTGSKCGASRFGVLIAPGSRTRSLLWQKVSGTQDCGRPMLFLDDAERERLGRYIDALEP